MQFKRAVYAVHTGRKNHTIHLQWKQSKQFKQSIQPTQFEQLKQLNDNQHDSDNSTNYDNTSDWPRGRGNSFRVTVRSLGEMR